MKLVASGKGRETALTKTECFQIIPAHYSWLIKCSFSQRMSKCNYIIMRPAAGFWAHYNIVNKFAQSNLGTGPRRGTVAHVRRNVSIGYNGALQIRRQNYPFPWTDPQTPLPASSLDPFDLSSQTLSGSDPPFYHNVLDRQTDAQTNKSSTGKFGEYRPLRYESDAT